MKRQLATFVPQDQKAQRSQIENEVIVNLNVRTTGSDHTCEVTDFEARDGLVTLLSKLILIVID